MRVSPPRHCSPSPNTSSLRLLAAALRLSRFNPSVSSVATVTATSWGTTVGDAHRKAPHSRTPPSTSHSTITQSETEKQTNIKHEVAALNASEGSRVDGARPQPLQDRARPQPLQDRAQPLQDRAQPQLPQDRAAGDAQQTQPCENKPVATAGKVPTDRKAT